LPLTGTVGLNWPEAETPAESDTGAPLPVGIAPCEEGEERADAIPLVAADASTLGAEANAELARDNGLARTELSSEERLASGVAVGLARSELIADENAGATGTVGLARTDRKAEDRTGSAVAIGFESTELTAEENAGFAVPDGLPAKELRIDDSDATGRVAEGFAAIELRREDNGREPMFKFTLGNALTLPEGDASAVTPAGALEPRRDDKADATAVGMPLTPLKATADPVFKFGEVGSWPVGRPARREEAADAI